MNDDPNTLNQLITEHADAALDALEALSDFRFEDDQQRTPMAAAIRTGNLAALRVMLRSKQALEYFPPLDKALRRQISREASLATQPVEETELRVAGSVGGLQNFERTPLLEACRHGHREAIGLLVEAGAKANATDALKESALSLCLHQGAGLAEFFMDCCIDRRARFAVDDQLLGALCAEPGLYQKAVSHGRLSKHTQHFRFCLACALVEPHEVTRLLNAGYELSAKRPYEYDPLLEAVTSDMLRTWNHPRKRELAAPLVRSLEDPNADLALSSDPTLQADEIIQRRLALADLLVDRGLERPDLHGSCRSARHSARRGSDVSARLVLLAKRSRR